MVEIMMLIVPELLWGHIDRAENRRIKQKIDSKICPKNRDAIHMPNKQLSSPEVLSPDSSLYKILYK